jgi:hypothetical protein
LTNSVVKIVQPKSEPAQAEYEDRTPLAELFLAAAATVGLLAPRLTPFLSFLRIALIDHSSYYLVISSVFILLHTWHGIHNLAL